MKKMLVILSGGQDSTTCLYMMKVLGYEIHAVTFDYGQRHWVEIEAARTVSKLAEVATWELIKLDGLLFGDSPLTSDNKLDTYENFDALATGIEKTFVPLRNQLFLTVAANRAYVLKCDAMVIGVSEADYGGYPDCRDSFIRAIESTMNHGYFTGEEGTRPKMKIKRPLMNLSKKETVEFAVNLPGCYKALAYSHTSYSGEYPPVQKDHATLLRARGFQEAGVPDPIYLRAFKEGLISQLPDEPNYDSAILQKYFDLIEG